MPDSEWNARQDLIDWMNAANVLSGKNQVDALVEWIRNNLIDLDEQANALYRGGEPDSLHAMCVARFAELLEADDEDAADNRFEVVGEQGPQWIRVVTYESGKPDEHYVLRDGGDPMVDEDWLRIEADDG